jgi:integrase
MHEVIISYRARVLPDKAPATQKEYRKALDRLDAVFGPNHVKDIRPVHIYQYQDARAAQGALVTVNRDIATLSGVFNHAIRLGHVDVNPCRQVRRRSETPRDRYVTDAELAIVYGLASEWMQRAIRMACITGIRLGDLMKISDANITPEGFLYQQGKTGRKMLIEWTDSLREAAQRPPVSYEGFTSAWQRLMKKAVQKGVQRFTFHDLRAKAGSEAIDWRLLGHTDRHTFERIYNRLPTRVKIS